MTSEVIQMIEKSWKDRGIKVVNSYTSDPDIRKGYKNSKRLGRINEKISKNYK